MTDYVGEAQAIAGSTSGDELSTLEELATEYITEGGSACEIGAENGRSTYVLANVCKEKNAKLWVVDIDIKCEEVLRDLPVVFVEGDSKDKYEEVPGSLDFVFIDGDHRLPTVLYDFVNFWDKLRSGGLLIAHDYRDMETSDSEVKMVVDNMWKFRTGRWLGGTSLWWKEK